MSDFSFLPTSPALRTPAARRISLPASQRLMTITEGAPPPDPERWYRLSALRASTSSAATHRTAPPPYEWAPPPAVAGEGASNVNEEEKLARVRSAWAGATDRRGGWGRLAMLVAAILLLLGLVIGLGVGLTVGRHRKDVSNADTGSNATDAQTGSGSTLLQRFPLGRYSFLTTLRASQTNCTSNSATWRCYPYTVFDPSDVSTATSSQATFDWIVKNTSDTYATNATTSTGSSGVPANLTISSTNNPFALTFDARHLTYISDNSNGTVPKLTFSFPLPKVVIPTSALTSDNAATQCFFNSTVLSGSIYLAASAAGEAASTNASTGSYETWPYAIEIVQSSAGGTGTPECYESVNEGIGNRVIEGLEPQPEEDECRCEYRNYG